MTTSSTKTTTTDSARNLLRPFPDRKGWPYKYDYNRLLRLAIDHVERNDVETARNIVRALFLEDLFFMVYYGLGRRDINSHQSPWLVKVCREIEDGPQTDTIDLWARGHYKSTIITQARSLQEILRSGGELTVGIFSHTRPVAKSFLRPLKTALERNELLRWAFPDVIWEDPRRDAPVWSMDEGLVLRRRSESNTATLEAWGLTDGMPTGKHYGLRVYDDLVTEDIARSPEQMAKVEKAFRLSDNLGTKGGRQRIIGTIYHHADLYCTLIREAEEGKYPWHVRKRPWYDLDLWEQHEVKSPVLLSADEIVAKRVRMGPFVWATQMELEPATEENRRFQPQWLRYYDNLPTRRNKYLFVDPANSKKKDSDYTVMAVVSIDALGNRYLEDLVRERLDLGERWRWLKRLVMKHGADMRCYYERYGAQSDIYYIRERMAAEGVYFAIDEVAGRVAKADRIERLVPIFESGRFWLPKTPIYREGRDVVREFIDEELLAWPFSRHDDMLDAISRVEDPDVCATGPLLPSTRHDLTRVMQERNLREARVAI